MQSQRTAYGWALKIEPGEEIIAGLSAFGVRHGVRAGIILGLGARGRDRARVLRARHA